MSTIVSEVAFHGPSEVVGPPDVPAVSGDVRTLADLPVRLLNRFPGKVLMKRASARGGIELTGAQIFERVRDLSVGLSQLGVLHGDRVAIVSESRPEWVVADLAILVAGAVTVPVYPTQSAAQIEFILADSRAKVVVVSGPAQLEKIRRIRGALPHLEMAVVIDAPGDSERPYPDALPLALIAAQGRAVLEVQPGAAERVYRDLLERDDREIATIVYTMDQSGELKGAMLTHANLLANVRATSAVLPVRADDLALSLLPLSHVFERMALFRYLSDGVPTVFVESLMTVMRDLKRAQPTLMTGVPRVYEKFLTAVQEDLARSSRARRAILKWALATGRRHAQRLAAGQPVGKARRLAYRIADRLVLSRMRQAVGGRLRCLVSGSAALPANVSDFFAAIGLPIYEGYGLTETSPVLTTNGPGNVRPGTVGKPLPGVEIRIAADGEILARGPNVTCGYFQRPDLNGTAFEGSWFHTGDIGRQDADGYLTITDRKKDLLVTAGGKKIAPGPLEAWLMRSRLVAEAVLIGENRKFPSALIVPDFAELEARLAAAGAPRGSREDLVQRADVVQIYQNLIDELNAGLSQFERIKRLALLPRDVILFRGAGTTTMLKRRQAVEHAWQHVVDRLYANGTRDID